MLLRIAPWVLSVLLLGSTSYLVADGAKLREQVRTAEDALVTAAATCEALRLQDAAEANAVENAQQAWAMQSDLDMMDQANAQFNRGVQVGRATCVA